MQFPKSSKGWEDTYLCMEENAPYHLFWSRNESDIDRSQCLVINEPKDKEWDQIFLCHAVWFLTAWMLDRMIEALSHIWSRSLAVILWDYTNSMSIYIPLKKGKENLMRLVIGIWTDMDEGKRNHVRSFNCRWNLPERFECVVPLSYTRSLPWGCWPTTIIYLHLQLNWIFEYSYLYR